MWCTRLNDRDWWNFGSQEEVDRYVALCRIQNVESVKSMTELKERHRQRNRRCNMSEEQAETVREKDTYRKAYTREK